ncbi:MAG: cation diffusion facilitator family transporter, partial [Acidimicrobiales bacterium]
VAVGILLVAIVLEAFSLRTAVVESRHAKGNQGWWTFVRRAKVPELPVVLLEDVGAMLGLVLALLGVGLASVTHDPMFDALGTVGIGVLLGVIAVVLMVEMKSLLLGEGASPATVDTIRRTIEAQASVRRVIHLRTLHLGPEELLVGAKLELDPTLAGPGLAAAINEIEASVRSQVPEARVTYLEPDVAQSDNAQEVPS